MKTNLNCSKRHYLYMVQNINSLVWKVKTRLANVDKNIRLGESLSFMVNGILNILIFVISSESVSRKSIYKNI